MKFNCYPCSTFKSPNLSQQISVILFSVFLFIDSAFALNFQQPLLADKAFIFSAQAISNTEVKLTWKIADNYYLYRDRFNFKTTSPIKLGEPVFPAGISKIDPILGAHEVFEKSLSINLPLLSGGPRLNLNVSYQGCSSFGFCYPPMTKEISLDLTQHFGEVKDGSTMPVVFSPETTRSPPDFIAQLFDKNIILLILGFLGLGLLLSFTPCVLPMVPILSGIIIGHGKNITPYKAFVLSATYVISMATTYAVAGIIAGMLGNTIQASLQSPWIIGTFSAVFAVLAFSLFGFYELQLPLALRQRLNNFSQRWQGGSLISVFIMGCLSTLIVSPCVTPPLVGVLSYISQTGNAVLGGFALFTMGIGMGIPLIIIGTSSGKLLPKAGAWMNNIKSLFGVVMLGVAIVMLQRVLPAPLILILWAALSIILAIYVGAFDPHPTTIQHRLFKGLGLILFVYGVILLIGGAMGNSDPFRPLDKLRTPNQTSFSNELQFSPIKNTQDLTNALQTANKLNKPVLLDFYADWCISCQKIEHDVFTSEDIKKTLKNFILLKADVTENNSENQALQKSLGVIAPPTLIFFDPQEKEIRDTRIVGEISTEELSTYLQRITKTIE